MTDAVYRGRHRAPAGRHRAPASSASSLPRFATSGYLVPTAAAATLVLTATGSHFGTSIGPTAVTGATTLTPTASGTASASPGTPPIERDVPGRAGRDSSRAATATSDTATDALPISDEENARLQAQAAANAAPPAVAPDAQARVKAQAEAAQADAAHTATAHAWVPPISGAYALTSGFGMRWGSLHPGQDFAIPVGTPVKALSTGTVVFAGWEGGYGNKLEIRYWDGTVSWYAHNSKLLVAKGENVSPGETVSMSGNTGHSTGAHLHVEIHPDDGSPVPPLPWLKTKGIMP